MTKERAGRLRKAVGIKGPEEKAGVVFKVNWLEATTLALGYTFRNLRSLIDSPGIIRASHTACMEQRLEGQRGGGEEGGRGRNESQVLATGPRVDPSLRHGFHPNSDMQVTRV